MPVLKALVLFALSVGALLAGVLLLWRGAQSRYFGRALLLAGIVGGAAVLVGGFVPNAPRAVLAVGCAISGVAC